MGLIGRSSGAARLTAARSARPGRTKTVAPPTSTSSGYGQEELAGLDDRRHRVHELRPGVAVVPDDAITSSTRVLVDADHDRGVRLLQEAARAGQPRRPEVALEERVDERAGVLGVDDRDDELHAAEYRAAAAPDRPRRRAAACRSVRSGTDRPIAAARGGTRDRPAPPAVRRRIAEPRPPPHPTASSLQRRPLARGADVDADLGDLLAGAAAVGRASWPALFVREPSGRAAPRREPTASRPARRRRSRPRWPRPRPSRSRSPPARAGRPIGRAGDRRPTAAPRPASTCRSSSPATASTSSLGVVSFGWSGEREIDERRPRLLAAAAGLAALALDRARLASLVDGAGDWLARVAGTDAADRAREPPDARPRPRAGDRPGRAAQGPTCRWSSSTSTRSGRRTPRPARRPATTSSGRSRPSSPSTVRLVDTVARIGGDEFVVVAPGSGGVVVAQRVLDAVEALGPIGGRAGRPCRPGSPASRSTAPRRRAPGGGPGGARGRA